MKTFGLLAPLGCLLSLTFLALARALPIDDAQDTVGPSLIDVKDVYMWCGGWETTRNCAGFPANYRCNPATGAPIKRQSDPTCDRQCRCIPKCSIANASVGGMPLCGIISSGGSINVVDSAGKSVGTIKSVALDGAYPGADSKRDEVPEIEAADSKRDEAPAIEFPAINATVDYSYSQWYLDCGTTHGVGIGHWDTVCCSFYGEYVCDPDSGKPIRKLFNLWCDQNCRCKPVCSLSAEKSIAVCKTGITFFGLPIPVGSKRDEVAPTTEAADATKGDEASMIEAPAAPVTNNTADEPQGLYLKWYLDCASTERTGNCRHNYGYTCDSKTGAPGRTSISAVCDSYCTCKPVCTTDQTPKIPACKVGISFLIAGFGHKKRNEVPTIEAIEASKEDEVPTIEAANAADAAKRDEGAIRAPAINATADEAQGLSTSWYLDCTSSSITNQCETRYGYGCDQSTGTPKQIPKFNPVPTCQSLCVCKAPKK